MSISDIFIPAGWKVVHLSEVIAFVVDNRGRSAPLSSSGIPLIATNCITHEGLYPIYKNVRYVSEENYRTWFRAHPKPGDVIFVNKGTPGMVCQVPDPVNFCFAQDMVALRPNTELIDSDYFFAALRSPFFQEQVKAFSVGTTIPHLKKSDFPKLVLPLPPRVTQQHIGRLYCNLSKKIEVNRRINRTLEQMAQALYQHWFVDFGPFQDGEFVESELGPIPKGWEVKPLDQIATYLNGLALQKYPPEGNDSLPVIKIAEMRRGIVESTSRASTKIERKFIVEDGDILFSWSGTLEVCLWCGGRGALNQHLFKVTSEYFPKWFYYYATKYHLPRFQEIAANKVTTMGHIQRYHLAEAKVPVPPQQLFGQFDRKMSPILAEQINNELENRKLAEIRDYLLPKLLSGAISVDAAEEAGIEQPTPS